MYTRGILDIFIVITMLVLGLITMKAQNHKKNHFLLAEINRLEVYIQYKDSLNTEVSQASVAWHIDHTLLTINRIYEQMQNSEEKSYKRRFNIGRTMMFTFGKIPRGRAESPKIVRPKTLVLDSIKKHLKQAKIRRGLFDSLPRKAHFTHPYIGMLNRKQAKKFLEIHTNHHLEIIQDILVVNK